MPMLAMKKMSSSAAGIGTTISSTSVRIASGSIAACGRSASARQAVVRTSGLQVEARRQHRGELAG
jgi:hypothetical protein